MGGEENMRLLIMFFDIHLIRLFAYHQLVMEEMMERGYRVSKEWLVAEYRGMKCPRYDTLNPVDLETPIYPEHNQDYLQECLWNLKAKGIDLPINKIK